MKAMYKISTGLWDTQDQEFESDQEAWDTLRLQLPHKWGTLFKWGVVKVPVVNVKSYVEKNNAKYTSQLITEETAGDCQRLIPVLRGITDDKYDII